MVCDGRPADGRHDPDGESFVSDPLMSSFPYRGQLPTSLHPPDEEIRVVVIRHAAPEILPPYRALVDLLRWRARTAM